MARKKKKPVKKKKNQKSLIKRLFWFLLYSLLISSTLAGAFYFIFLRPGTEPASLADRAKKPPLLSRTTKFRPAPSHQESAPEPLYEEPSPPTISPQQHKKVIPHQGQQRPRVAIIIDDMGHRRQTGSRLIDLPLPLTFAFLPQSPHQTELINQARAKQRDILLHQPMEASSSKWDPGPGALFIKMSNQEIETQVEKNIQAMPHAIGVNNHMGSLFTTNHEKMTAALKPLKRRQLFFIDSLTSANSVAAQVAKEAGLKTARRQVFLDNEQEAGKIKKQLDRLVNTAKSHGSAIGIGHPYSATLATLEKHQDWLDKEVEVVPVHQLVN